MNEIKLMPHNQELVYSIEQAMVNGNHKIFYTEATGLGKSFVFMYLVYKYFRTKKVLYICPKTHIWYNMQAYEEFNLIKDCVTMVCNADFDRIKNRHRGYDAIFIDEAHHLTAPIQGTNILKLVDMTIEQNPSAYVFGLTATPYVDGVMIGEKYFDTSVVGMDLTDAINNQILQKINYAIAIKEPIVLSDEEKDHIQKYNVDTTSNTIVDIVNQYSKVQHWLVYFSRIDELNANIPYFSEYFPDYKVFVIHSDVDKCDHILKEFEAYPGKAFMVSVSMVLEGIHLKSVEGVLLYRNIHSMNTFLQIVGRLGIINPNSNPIMVDIYESYKNIKMGNNNEDDNDDHNTNNREKATREYVYVKSNTYKFIEFVNILNAFRMGRAVREYREYTWSCDTELSLKLGKNCSYVNYWRRKGKTYEEIIDMVLDNPDHYEYRGYTWSSDIGLSLKLGKSPAYVSNWRRKGKTYEEIIDMVFGVHEYRGYTWSSDRELSLKLGKCPAYVGTWRRKGKTYEEIIDMVLGKNIDH